MSERICEHTECCGYYVCAHPKCCGYGGRPRPCLVCEQPCTTEGQLCPTCAAAGHSVTDTEVHFVLDVRYPPT